MSLRLSFAFAAALFLVACNQASADKDPAQTDTDSNPNYKQARQDLDNNNPQAAAGDYEAALAANPKLAGAHYELGMIYGDKLSDPISSIYHFKCFLSLSPSTDKKEQVQALIDKEGQDFAASLPQTKPQITQADMDKLTADNAALKKQVDDANTTIAQLQGKLKSTPASGATMVAADTAAAPASSAGEAPAGAASSAPSGPAKAIPVDPAVAASGDASTPAAGDTGGAPPAGSRTYTVMKGDNYWKIAHKMYPHHTKEGVDKIREANKQLNERNIKPGQVLVIP